MATSTFPTLVTGVTVQTATTGSLSGDGSSGNKLAVGVDGVTIAVNGSNQLEVLVAGEIGGTNTQIQYNNSGAFGGFGSWDGATLTLPSAITTALGTSLTIIPNTSDLYGGQPLFLAGSNAADANNAGYAALVGGYAAGTGKGGNAYLAAGDGGTAGYININGGTATADDHNGGDVEIWAGAKNGSGGDGRLRLMLAGYAGLAAQVTGAGIFQIAVPFGDDANYQLKWSTSALGVFAADGTTAQFVKAKYKSSDGSTGASAGPFTVITAITVKDGLITSITGS